MTDQKKKFGRSRIFSNMSPFEGLLLGFVTMGVSENLHIPVWKLKRMLIQITDEGGILEDIFEESESDVDMFTFTADSDKRASSSESSSFFSDPDDILDEDEEDFEPIFPDTESDDVLFDDDEVTYSDSSDDLDDVTVGVYEVKSVLSQLHAFRESVEDDGLEAMRGIGISKADDHSTENDKKDTEIETSKTLVETQNASTSQQDV